jgi:hypothetical protein
MQAMRPWGCQSRVRVPSCGLTRYNAWLCIGLGLRRKVGLMAVRVGNSPCSRGVDDAEVLSTIAEARCMDEVRQRVDPARGDDPLASRRASLAILGQLRIAR